MQEYSMLCALILTYLIAILYVRVQADSWVLQHRKALIHSALIATLQLVKKLTQSPTRLVKGSLVVVWD